MASPNCSIDGNSDLYGLGIRLGIYSQVISTLLTNHLLPGESGTTWIANFIFVSALIVAFIRQISDPQSFNVAEGFVILQLILVFFLAVLSASGGFFILIDFLTSVADGNLPVDTLVTYSRDLGGTSGENMAVIFGRCLSKLSNAYLDGSPLRLTLRLVLSLTTSCLNLWFWISGVRTLQRRPGCSSHVFLFARVGTHGSARSFFIIFAVAYLGYHVIILIYRVSPIFHSSTSFVSRLLENIDPRSTAERLSSEERKMLESLRSLSGLPGRQLTRKGAGRTIRSFLHVVMFTWSSVVIAYSILAVELTLAWNNISGIYSVHSTGQFIPLLIGLVGLVRAITAVFIQHIAQAKTKTRESPHLRLPDDGRFQYRISSRNKVVFEARKPQRRWSFDERTTQDNTSPPKKLPVLGNTQPVLPIFPNEENLRLKDAGLGNRARIRWGSARFIYTNPSGRQHVFHDRFLSRRVSFEDDRALRRIWPEPHLVRTAFATPLRLQKDVEDHEQSRRRWWRYKVAALRDIRRRKMDHQTPELSRTRWQTFWQGNEEQLSRFSYDHSIPWLPNDITDETLLWTRYGEPRGRASSSTLRLPRRNLSSDDVRTAYSSYSPHELPFMRSQHPSSDYDSRYARTDSMSQTHRRYSYQESMSSADASSRRPRTRTSERTLPWRFKVLILFKWVINLLCLGGCCVALFRTGKAYEQRWHNSQFDKQIRQTSAQQPTKACNALYHCHYCDRDLQSLRQTRGWHGIYPSRSKQPPIRSRMSREIKYVSSLSYTDSVIKRIFKRAKKSMPRSQTLREFSDALEARFIEFMDAMLGRPWNDDWDEEEREIRWGKFYVRRTIDRAAS